ncbi:hypothetical protein [Streptomyces atroolivaceus]|uniref:hypothetical protein n=1 Tax=Streptomyces atroolivaceus TaxID=66869 RepID=UPI003F4D646D
MARRPACAAPPGVRAQAAGSDARPRSGVRLRRRPTRRRTPGPDAGAPTATARQQASGATGVGPQPLTQPPYVLALLPGLPEEPRLAEGPRLSEGPRLAEGPRLSEEPRPAEGPPAAQVLVVEHAPMPSIASLQSEDG